MENKRLKDLKVDETQFRLKLSEKQIATERSYEAEMTKKDIHYDKTISRMTARAEKEKVTNKLKESETK